MTILLGTGGRRRLLEFEECVARHDRRCVTAPDLATLEAAVAGLAEPINAYVQLPVDIDTSPSTAVGRVRDLLSEGLVARCAAVEIALTSLAEGGRIVLVAGNVPGDPEVPDDRSARFAMLRVLADAIATDGAARGITPTVLSSAATMEDVVAAALGERSGDDAKLAHSDDMEEDASVDWFHGFAAAVAHAAHGRPPHDARATSA